MTWFDDIPQPLLDLLTEFELHGIGKHSIFKDRHHIVLDDVQYMQIDGYDLMKAVPIIPEGVNREMFQMNFFPATMDRVLHTLPLTIVLETECSVKAKKVLIWNARDALEEFFPMPVHWVVDSQSIMIPIQDNQGGKVHVLEMFSGGYGGWSYAQRFLRQNFALDLQITSIEEDLAAACYHSFNHDTVLVEAKGPHDDILQNSNRDVTIHGDIRSQQWWGSLAKWGVDGFTISAPCGPWSGASFSPGLKSQPGMLFPEALMLARIFRPKWILMENVVGFKTHAHRKFCLAILKACNYRMVWSKEVDAAEFGASQRQRWLGFAVSNSACKNVANSFELWPNIPSLTPEIIGAIFPNPPDASALVVTQKMRSFAHEWILLPPQEKPGLEKSTGQQIFKSRCFVQQQKHPTFMAQYGSQHEMSRNQLEVKGYYAHFFQQDDGNCRLLHPSEIAMIHLHWDKILISHEMKEGWKNIGNMITIPHALLMLSNAYAICHDVRLPSIEEIFLSLFQTRLVQHNVRQFSGRHATMFADHLQIIPEKGWTSAIESFDQLMDFVQNEGLQQKLWTSDLGIIELKDFISVTKQSIPSQITDVEEHESDISPTQAFSPLLKVQIEAKEQTGNLWVAADVGKEALHDIYEGHFEIKTFDDDFTGLQFKLVPRTLIDILDESSQSVAIPCISENTLTIVDGNCQNPIKRKLIQTGFNNDLCDQFGPIEDATKPFHGMLIADFVFDTKQNINILGLMAAWKQTETSFVWNSVNLSWKLSIQGDFQACLAVEFFWITLIPRDLQNHLGIFAENDQTQIGRNIHYKMNQAKIPLPPSAISMTLSVLASRSFLDHLSTIEGVQITLKFQGRTLWKGTLSPDLNLLIIAEALTFTMQPIMKGSAIRLIGKGQSLYDITIGQLISFHGCSKVTLHIMNSLSGGAGNKENQKVHVRNSIASTLLEQGFDIQWVSQTIDSIMKKCGTKAPLQSAQMAPGKQRIDSIMALCKDAGIDIPSKIVKDATAVAKVGATFQQKRKVVIQPTPEDYQIQPGFLQNEDGTEVVQIKEISSNASGILLLNKERATPWLREGQVISSDELAIAIIGTDIDETTLQTDTVNIPCWDKNQQSVILLCQLVQLGEKKIAPKVSISHPVPHEHCCILAMTLWKEDWESKKWEMAMDTTNAFLRMEWKMQNLDEGIVSIWGKSLRQNKNPSNAMFATSMQVHCSVKASVFDKIMRASGFNQIFIVPKDDKGRINQDFRVIWIEGDVAHLTIIAAKTNKCQGLVKAKNTMGLRYHKDDFETAWKVVFPGKEPPIDTLVNHIYRIEPLPFGCTSDMLIRWSSTVKWPLKPIKAAGPKSWIIGATTHPTQQVLVFNGQPILAKLIPPKQQSSVSPIVAGPKPTTHSLQKMDPFQTNDPWAKYQGASANPVNTTQPPRDLAGPTETKFQQQENRIMNVEQALQKLQQETQAGFKAVEQREHHFQNVLKKDLQAMRQDIDTSVQQALVAQSSKLDNTLSELKSLFAQTAKRSRNALNEDDKDLDAPMESPAKPAK